MAKTFTIGELARSAEVPTSTLRYYERIQLLIPSGRSAGNYRLYGEESLERVQFIRAAQATGFELQDVATLLELRSGETEPCGEVQTLIESRLSEIEQRMRDLRRVKKVLTGSLKLCQEAENNRCHVIDKLSGGRKKKTRKKKR